MLKVQSHIETFIQSERSAKGEPGHATQTTSISNISRAGENSTAATPTESSCGVISQQIPFFIKPAIWFESIWIRIDRGVMLNDPAQSESSEIYDD